jgi:hypothetical protein
VDDSVTAAVFAARGITLVKHFISNRRLRDEAEGEVQLPRDLNAGSPVAGSALALDSSMSRTVLLGRDQPTNRVAPENLTYEKPGSKNTPSQVLGD